MAFPLTSPLGLKGALARGMQDSLAALGLSDREPPATCGVAFYDIGDEVIYPDQLSRQLMLDRLSTARLADAASSGEGPGWPHGALGSGLRVVDALDLLAAVAVASRDRPMLTAASSDQVCGVVTFFGPSDLGRARTVTVPRRLAIAGLGLGPADLAVVVQACASAEWAYLVASGELPPHQEFVTATRYVVPTG